MSDERKELLEEANELGLEFPSNIKTDKLKDMVNESKGPAVKEDEVPEVDDTETKDTDEDTPKNKALTMRQKTAIAKKRASKTQIVTITNRDKRENEEATTVNLSFENQFFGLSRTVPLDIPVELEQALIDIAECTPITLHKDEIVDGRRTGNKVAITVKKFAVSYGKPVE